MSSHIRNPLSLRQKANLVFRLLPVILKALTWTLATVLRRFNFSSKLIRQTFQVCLTRGIWSLPVLDMRNMSRTTGQVVKTYCESEKLLLESFPIQAEGFPPATLHFIDTKAADNESVVLYLHGGGYIFPLSTPAALKSMRKVAALSSRKLVVLEYTLSPEVKYPGQLAQAAGALRYLLQTRKPSQIVVGGDSAGGNLTLGLLAHMKTPHPSIDSITLDGEDNQLAAAFGLSPRTGRDTSAPSYTDNADKDYMGSSSMKLIMSKWQPDSEHVWATPNQGDKVFWNDLRAKRLLLVAGADEVYVDDVRRFAELVGAEDGAKTRQLKIAKGELHDQWLMDVGRGDESGITTFTLMEWAGTI